LTISFGKSGPSRQSASLSSCDREPGLTYLNNRHYDPVAGVFLSVDPIVAMTREPYIYGSANPATLSDPTGLRPDCDACKGNRPSLPNPGGGGDDPGNEGTIIIHTGFEPADDGLWTPTYASTEVDAQVLLLTRDYYTPCQWMGDADIACSPDIPSWAIAGFVYHSSEDLYEENGGVSSALKALAKRGIRLLPYGGKGGGHHILSKALFRGDDLYDVNKALAIPNETLTSLRLSHPSLSGTQRTLYAEARRSGQILTIDGAAEIEIRALMRHGVDRTTARQIVRAAVDDLASGGINRVSYHPGMGPIA
jgi:RHS repeat-associated protein